MEMLSRGGNKKNRKRVASDFNCREFVRTGAW